MGTAEKNKTDKLLREIIGAYRATQNQDLSAPDQIKHLRYQVARLARLCMELNKRIIELELGIIAKPVSKDKASKDKEEWGPNQLTPVGDII